MSLADKIKETRKRLGWNQATLAEKSDVTQATISRIESGQVTQPKMDQLKKIAAALGVTVDYLIGDSSQMSFDDLLTADENAAALLRGYEDLSKKGRDKLASFVNWLLEEEGEDKEVQ